MTFCVSLSGGCIYSNKDKNFKANHNFFVAVSLRVNVVSIVTKIRILKQITTNTIAGRQDVRCIYSNKDKNFKANHNQSALSTLHQRLYL